MKKLVSPSTTFIVTTQRFATAVAHHDSWYAHAVNFVGIAPNIGATLQWYLFFVFTLKDGNDWWYPTGPFATHDDSLAYWDRYLDYQNRDGLKGFAGEYFNFVVRPSILDKVAQSDVSAWLAAH